MIVSAKKYITALASTAVLGLALYGCGGGGGGEGPVTGSETTTPNIGEIMMPDDGATTIPDDGDGERIDLSEFLTPAIEQGTAPGMIAAIVDTEGVRAIGAAGLRRQDSTEMITNDDLVHIGSDTKAMTSTMLATLVKDGTFADGWDTTIADVFPELVGAIHQDYHSVTLSQLVRMQGGIAANAADWPAHSSNPDIVGRRYDILKDNLATPPAGTVGEHLYSNLSYMVAGAMAERLTGKNWETLMQERLFAPLGITSAGFGAPGTPDEVDQPWGHSPDESGVWVAAQFDNPAAFGPAGTVHISIEDWAKFISLWFTDKEPAILDRNILDELSTPEAGNYAAGWLVYQQEWAGGTVLHHNGTNTFWFATLWISPSLGVAYVAVANSADFYEDRGVYTSLDSIIYNLITSEQLSRDAGDSRDSTGNAQDEVSSERPWLLDPTGVRAVTGAQSPEFSSEDVGENVSRLKSAANALLASDLLVLTGDGVAVRGQTTCLNSECSLDIAETALTLSATEVEFGGSALAYQAVASHHGVSLAEGRGETSVAGTSIDYNAYGGWMQHSSFVIETSRIADGLFGGTPVINSYSVGDAPNTNPAAAGGSGTWRGVMVGADVSQTATRGHLIQGNAEITISEFHSPKANIAFTQIFDLNAQTQRDDLTWDGIQVTAGGFASGADQDSIEGRFYGPNHEEVGGIFERNRVLGAFGANRAMNAPGYQRPLAIEWRNNPTAEDLLDHWNDPEALRNILALSSVNQADIESRRTLIKDLIDGAGSDPATSGTVLRIVNPDDIEIIGERDGITYAHWKGGPAGTLNIEFDWQFAPNIDSKTRAQAERAGKFWSHRLLDDFGTHSVTAGTTVTARGSHAGAVQTMVTYTEDVETDGVLITVTHATTDPLSSGGPHNADITQNDYEPWHGKMTLSKANIDERRSVGNWWFVHVLGHEIGHIVGVTNHQGGWNVPSIERYMNYQDATFEGPESQRANGGNPVPFQWLDGRQEVPPFTPGATVDYGHLGVCSSLMAYCNEPREVYEPSEIDFAYLDDIGYEILDADTASEPELYGHGA